MNNTISIFGAGIAGLLAATHFQNAEVFEAGSEDQVRHKALMRFRTPDIGDSIGIKFDKVKVHKGIWDGGKFVQPDIKLANQYSKKVISGYQDRSIWNIDTVERYIAPENIVEILAGKCGNRVHWNTPVTWQDLMKEGVKISTIPMPVMIRMVNERLNNKVKLSIIDDKFNGVVAPEFKHSKIMVKRWRVKNANVHQTIYVPGRDTSLYRASITGDLLTAEYVNNFDNYDVLYMFGIHQDDVEFIDGNGQQFGKIENIDDAWRKNFIYQLSRDFNIFSLGRFGVWKNILMDDVLQDISVIKRLMTMNEYEHRNHCSSLL